MTVLKKLYFYWAHHLLIHKIFSDCAFQPWIIPIPLNTTQFKRTVETYLSELSMLLKKKKNLIFKFIQFLSKNIDIHYSM